MSIGELLGVESPLANWAIKATLVASVARIHKPGTRFEIMPVMVSQEGVDTRPFWENLVPEKHLFSDELDASASDTKIGKATFGKMISETRNITHLKKGNYYALKSFITRTEDFLFPPKRRKREWIKRGFVPVGYTTEYKFLSHFDTEHRRFIAIDIGKAADPKHIEAYFAENRDQIWAEAKHYYEQGFPLYLEGELKEMQKEDNARRIASK